MHMRRKSSWMTLLSKEALCQRQPIDLETETTTVPETETGKETGTEIEIGIETETETGTGAIEGKRTEAGIESEIGDRVEGGPPLLLSTYIQNFCLTQQNL